MKVRSSGPLLRTWRGFIRASAGRVDVLKNAIRLAFDDPRHRSSLLARLADAERALGGSLSAEDYAEMEAARTVCREAAALFGDCSHVVPAAGPGKLAPERRGRRLAQTVIRKHEYSDRDEAPALPSLAEHVVAEAVARDFERLRPGERIGVHLLEHLLAERSMRERSRRGVYYSPAPVVGFIVRAIHDALKRDFGLADGLADVTSWSRMSTLGSVPRRPRPDTSRAPQAADGTAPVAAPSSVSMERDHEPFVRILDPAAGTGAFLLGVIDVIYETLRSKWHSAGDNPAQIAERWHDYVPRHLLPRLHGRELMPAACALARDQITARLAETGYALQPDEELHLRVGNSLRGSGRGGPADEPMFTVILGNPPYASRSSNDHSWTEALLADYKAGLGEVNINALSDDYVKFFRVTHARLVEAGAGVLGLVTNHSFLEGVTHRRMRELLGRDFQRMRVVNLHGSVMRRGERPNGRPDENVFDIQQGVAISILSRIPRRPPPHRDEPDPNAGTPGGCTTDIATVDATDPSEPRPSGSVWTARGCPPLPHGRGSDDARHTSRPCKSGHATPRGRSMGNTPPAADEPLAKVEYFDAIGDRSAKFELLGQSIETLPWRESPLVPPFFFIPRRPGSAADEYARWDSLADVFAMYSSGIKFRKDNLLVKRHFEPADVQRMIHDAATLPDEAFLARYDFRETNDWNLSEMRPLLRECRTDDIVEVLYRPFDVRCAFYPLDRITRLVPRGDARVRLMRHMLSGPNLGMLFNRQVVGGAVSHFLVSSRPVSHGTFYLGNKGQDYFAPLYLFGPAGRTANLRADWRERLSSAAELTGQATPEDALGYLYAVVHSAAYRRRYDALLRIDYPRVPLPRGRALFDALCALGRELMATHLMPVSMPAMLAHFALPVSGSSVTASGTPTIRLQGDSAPIIAARYPVYDADRVCVNPRTWFEPVSAAAWRFEVGGYAVARKWLRDRRGRKLTEADARTYGSIVQALEATAALIQRVDTVITDAGGWPAAFMDH